MTSNRHLTGDPVSNDDLLRFVDGALDDDGRVRVLTHLAARPAAVERVEAYLHQNAQLRQLREHLPMADSRDFAPDLQAAIADRLGRQRRRGWRRWSVAAAVALAVVGGSFAASHYLTPATPQLAAGLQSGPSLPEAVFLFDKPELAAATTGGEGSAGDHDAFDWLAGHVSDFSLEAPTLDQIGLSLIGSETFERQGIPAIRIVYRDAANNAVLLYAGVGKPDADHAFWLMREGYLSLQWRRGPMVFALVAPTDSPQLSDIVELVGAAVARIPLPPQESDAAAAAPVAPAATTESGPVQSIAVPIEPPPAAAAAPAAPAPAAPAADVETINPETLADPAANEPKPL